MISTELQSPGRFRKRFVKASSLPGSVKYCFFLNEVLQKLVGKMNVSFLKFINQDRETGVFGFLFVGFFSKYIWDIFTVLSPFLNVQKNVWHITGRPPSMLKLQ